MSRWCPSCRKQWPDEAQACTCGAYLVTDLDATVTCRNCGTTCPAHRQACPNCLSELVLDPERVASAMATLLAGGHRMPRPAGTAPFAAGPNCSLLRTAGRSPLIYCGPWEFMEASVDGMDHRAIPPLRCADLDGSLLFRLDPYEALDHAVVAVGRDGAPLGTYVRTVLHDPEDADWIGLGLHVRDETSAPVATLRPARRGGSLFQLVETGGDVLATCHRTDADLDGWIDDQWSLAVKDELPLKTLAGVALLLAAKVFLGRPSPTSTRRDDDRSPWDDDDGALTHWLGPDDDLRWP